MCAAEVVADQMHGSVELLELFDQPVLVALDGRLEAVGNWRSVRGGGDSVTTLSIPSAESSSSKGVQMAEVSGTP
jgi:hypothetical protein